MNLQGNREVKQRDVTKRETPYIRDYIIQKAVHKHINFKLNMAKNNGVVNT